MKSTLVNLILKYVVSLLIKVTPEQWDKAKALIVQAVLDLPHSTNEERKAFVVNTLKGLWTDLAPSVTNSLVELAFLYLKHYAQLAIL